MKKVGSDGVPPSTIQNSAYESLATGSQALANTLKTEQQASSYRGQMLMSSLEQLQQSNSFAAGAAQQIAQSKATQFTREAEAANTKGDNSWLGQVAKAAGSVAETYLKTDATNKELDYKERVAQQQAEEARRKAELEFQQEQVKVYGEREFTTASQEIDEFIMSWQESDGFKQKGRQAYVRGVESIVKRYGNIDSVQLKQLMDKAYAPAGQYVSESVAKAQKFKDDLRDQQVAVVESGLMFEASSIFADIRHSTYGDVQPHLDKLKGIQGKVFAREDLDELEKTTIIATVLGEGLKNLDSRNQAYSEVQAQLAAIGRYSVDLDKWTAQLEAGEISVNTFNAWTQKRRFELGVPTGYEDTEPFAAQQLAYDTAKREEGFRNMQQNEAIDVATKTQYSNENIGYLAYQIFLNPSLEFELMGDSVQAAIPGNKAAIQLAKEYASALKVREEGNLTRNSIAKDLGEIRKQGINWLISNSPNMKEPSVQQIVEARLGGQTPEQARAAIMSGGLTEEQRADYEAALQQIEVVLLDRMQIIESQQATAFDRLQAYGLVGRPEEIREVMSKRAESWNKQIEAVNKNLTGGDSSGNVGVKSPFNGGNNNSVSNFTFATTKNNGVTSVIPFAQGAKGVVLSHDAGFKTGQYGARRGNRNHSALDIAAPNATPLHFYMNGTVTKVKKQEGTGYGWYVDIKGEDGKLHRFAHLQSGSIGVKVGDKVRPGQKFAKTGDSGSPGSYHVHWEVRDPKQEYGFAGTTNPTGYLASLGMTASNVKAPTSAGSGWRSGGSGVVMPRAPMGSILLPGGRYISNGRVRQLGSYGGGTTQQTFNNANPADPGSDGSARGRKVTNNPNENYGYSWLSNSSRRQSLANAATKLNIPAQWLADIINFESNGKPNITNSIGATGLIQFMPETAKGLGTSTAALRGMTFEQQMNYVVKYLEPYKSKFHGVDYVYASIFGGGGFLNRYERSGGSANTSDINGGFQDHIRKLGKSVGRGYNFNRRERVATPTARSFKSGCRVCGMLQRQGKDFTPHTHSS